MFDFLRHQKARFQTYFVSFSDAFHLTVAKYNLTNQVELHMLQDYPILKFTLFRIIKGESERNTPLPSELVEEIQVLVFLYHPNKKRGGFVTQFMVGLGKTKEEVLEDQAAWNRYCAAYHAND